MRPGTSSGSSSRPQDLDELAVRFSGTLQFGTAGLRGELGAGPMRMNRSVVIRAAAGLAAYLRAKGQADGLVVIGYDARYKSADFARDTAAVMVGAGLRAAVLPAPAAHARTRLRHKAAGRRRRRRGHRQPQPAARQRLQGLPRRRLPDRAARRRGDRRRDRRDPQPRRRTARRDRLGHPRRRGPGRLPGAYGRRADRRLPPHGPRRLHRHARRRQGRPDRRLRPRRLPRARPRSRSRPSPTRPSRPSRSPTRRSRARWTSPSRPPAGSSPDIVIANDPDADRCAVAVPDDRARSGWRMLRGDEVGALLAAHLVHKGRPRRHRSPSRSCPPRCSAGSPKRPGCRTRRR